MRIPVDCVILGTVQRINMTCQDAYPEGRSCAGKWSGHRSPPCWSCTETPEGVPASSAPDGPPNLAVRSTLRFDQTFAVLTSVTLHAAGIPSAGQCRREDSSDTKGDMSLRRSQDGLQAAGGRGAQQSLSATSH